jgi:hypothetical protein
LEVQEIYFKEEGGYILGWWNDIEFVCADCCMDVFVLSNSVTQTHKIGAFFSI